jgi:predicted phosphodiesterase
MTYLLLSDIHSNIEALRSVLLEIISIRTDKYVILGDLVGYGASPNEVVKTIRKLDPTVAIRGNHDKVASGLSSGDDFNQIAYDAALWTKAKLSNENRVYLADLPRGPVVVDDLFDIMHGSHYDEDDYLLEPSEVSFEFRKSESRLTFFGHTHIPIIWIYDCEEKTVESKLCEYDTNGRYEFLLEKGKRYLINPGSVGQPRDMDPRASFVIFDEDNKKMTFFRIAYNIESSQQKIIKADLDNFLAERLSIGR